MTRVSSQGDREAKVTLLETRISEMDMSKTLLSPPPAARVGK